MKNTLIIGSNGFIGSHIKRSIGNIFLSRNSLNDKKIKIDLSKEIISKLDYDFNKINTIIHLAGISHHGGLTNAEITNHNMKITSNVFKFYNEIKANKLIFMSSGKVYGHNKGLPISEDSNLNPYDVIGNTKIEQEEYLYKNSSNEKKVISIRLFNAYGKNQGKNFVIPKILNSLFTKETLYLGNINVQRDFIYIKDVVSALVLLEHYEMANSFEIYNLSTSKATSIQKIIKIISKLKDLEIPYVVLEDLKRVESEIEIGCNKKIKSIGWNDKFNINDGLKDFLVS